MKRALLTIALIAVVASGAASIASAQGDLTLEGLAKRLDALLGRVDTHEQRLAAIETRIAPTATPRPTSTPAPTATSFAVECDASEILILEVKNVSAANAHRFQLIMSMGSGCDETDAVAFSKAHSAFMTLGTVPFHVLFYDFMCDSNLDSGALDVAFEYAPYGTVSRATEVKLGDYSKHELKLVASGYRLPCP